MFSLAYKRHRLAMLWPSVVRASASLVFPVLGVCILLATVMLLVYEVFCNNNREDIGEDLFVVGL